MGKEVKCEQFVCVLRVRLIFVRLNQTMLGVQ
jgi:hypothetical protein